MTATKKRSTAKKTAKVVTFKEVVDALVEKELKGVRPHKSTRLVNQYIAQGMAKGQKVTRVTAAIKAHVTKKLRESAVS